MKNVKNILIVILFVVILVQSFHKPNPSEPEIVTKTDTITLTVPHYIPKPYPVYKDTGSFHLRVDSFPIPTDTNAIVAAYIQKIAYADTLQNDSTAFILVVDTLQFNRIHSRSKTIRIYSRTKTIRIPLRSHFFAGLGVGGGCSLFGVTGNISLLSKRQRLYSASYNILNKSVFVSVQWKIK